jgi:hypothetical protein
VKTNLVEKQPCFLVILGPPAVGKMTVGQEIAKQTGFKLFHNHLMIDALLPIFEFDSEHFKKLVKEFRTRVFEEIIIERPKGLIFTFVINFKINTGLNTLLQWTDLFKQNDFKVYIAELEASLDVRLERNETPNRLDHKPSKRDLKLSRQVLLQNEHEWIMNSQPEFFKDLNYLRIKNENKTAIEVANLVVEHFKIA